MWTKVPFSVNMENVLFPSFHGNSSSLPAAAAVVPRIKMVSEVAGECSFRLLQQSVLIHFVTR